MSLSVTCPDCDKSLKLKDELAGKKIRCPGCSAVISIPKEDSEEDDFLDELEEGAPAKRKRRSAVDDLDDDDEPDSKPRSRKPVKKKSGSKSGGTNWLLIGGAGAGVALIFVVLFVVALNQARKADATWVTFRHPQGLAQVDMPGTPTFNAAQSQNGAQTYSLAKRNYNMSLTTLELNADIKRGLSVPNGVDLLFGEMETNVPKQIPGAQLISSRTMMAGEHRALELKVKGQGQITLARFYVTPTALIGAEFVTGNETTYAADREKYFNSIRGPDGNLINGPATPNPPGGNATSASNVVPMDSAPGVKPVPPLSLPKPPDASPIFNGQNLADEDPQVLMAAANQAANTEKNFAKAAQLQFWSVKKSNDGQYNLACYLSRSGQRDAALYWLQVAALEEGVDSTWVTQDPDMQPLWSDPRWKQVLPFLQKCNAYWSTSLQTDTQLVMPAGVGPSDPIPVMIGLHGMGGNAAGFVDADTYQEIADKARVAFLGVSGTIPRGPKSFVWSEDPVKDGARIEAALNEVKGRLTAKEGQLVLFGFSQGAMMSAEVAARSPDRYSGALVMSPGGNSEPKPDGFQRRSNGRKQNAICICGAGEHPGNVRMTKTYANLFQQAGARVNHKPYPNVNTHSMPPDYLDQLPTWNNFLLGST